jgi:hypothetical protein
LRQSNTPGKEGKAEVKCSTRGGNDERQVSSPPTTSNSSYDRICRSIAALAALHLGIQESEVNFMPSTLQDMKCKIHTAFGDSTDFIWWQSLDNAATNTRDIPRHRGHYETAWIWCILYGYPFRGHTAHSWILTSHNQRQRGGSFKKATRRAKHMGRTR